MSTLATSHAGATFDAIGVQAQVLVTDERELDEATRLVKDELRAFDLAASRFRVDSELFRVNSADGRAVEISPLLAEAIAVSLRAAKETGGDVDPTVGRSLRALGWDSDFVIILRRPSGPAFEVVPAAGWQRVELDAERRIVRVPRGVELDLGATAKAFAADRCASIVAAHTGAGVLVNLGGDLAVAGDPPAEGWPVLVTDDHRSTLDGLGQTVAVAHGGLATSSTTVRRWSAGGTERHHILDPRTGLPVREVWRTVTVAAASCVAANTASTAAIIRGESALDYLGERCLPARLVSVDGSVVTIAGWPGDAA